MVSLPVECAMLHAVSNFRFSCHEHRAHFLDLVAQHGEPLHSCMQLSCDALKLECPRLDRGCAFRLQLSLTPAFAVSWQNTRSSDGTCHRRLVADPDPVPEHRRFLLGALPLVLVALPPGWRQGCPGEAAAKGQTTHCRSTRKEALCCRDSAHGKRNGMSLVTIDSESSCLGEVFRSSCVMFLRFALGRHMPGPAAGELHFVRSPLPTRDWRAATVKSLVKSRLQEQSAKSWGSAIVRSIVKSALQASYWEL